MMATANQMNWPDAVVCVAMLAAFCVAVICMSRKGK